MPQKVFVYARTHDDRGNDKVLVIKEPDKDVFTLPQGDVPEGKEPSWVAYDVLKDQTGLGTYPDHQLEGIVISDPPDFIRLPRLEGRVWTGDIEVLCYSIEVNEHRTLTGNAMWIPWWSLRWDERGSTLMRFIMALMYAGISGWELKLDDQGNWTLPYLCTEGRRNHIVDDILLGELEIGIYDSFQDIIRKSTDRWLSKWKKPEVKTKETPSCPKDSWLIRLMRWWGALGR